MSDEQVDYIEAMGSAEGRRSLLIFRLNTAGIGSEDERAVRELLEEVAMLKKHCPFEEENIALKAEIARRDAPVTDAEVTANELLAEMASGDYCRYVEHAQDYCGCETAKNALNALILARATPPHGGKQ